VIRALVATRRPPFQKGQDIGQSRDQRPVAPSMSRGRLADRRGPCAFNGRVPGHDSVVVLMSRRALLGRLLERNSLESLVRHAPRS
jgi:hypothetical protein